MSLETILNQVNKFSGSTAKFSGAPTRQLLVQVVFNPALVNLDTFQDTLVQTLEASGWSIQGDQVSLGEVDVAGSTREIAYFYANVESQYTSDAVQNSIMNVFAAMNITVDSVSVSGSTAPLSNPNNIYTSKPPGKTLTGGNPNPNPNQNQNPNPNPQQPKSNWFTDLIMDDNGKLSTAGWGVLAAIGFGVIAVVSQKK